MSKVRKFKQMTDQDLMNFCYEHFCCIETCLALNCGDLCMDEDCPLTQLVVRFQNHIKDHPTEKGGAE